MAAIRRGWLRTMRALGVRRSNAAVRLIETLPARPVLNADSAAAMLDVDEALVGVDLGGRHVGRLAVVGVDGVVADAVGEPCGGLLGLVG